MTKVFISIQNQLNCHLLICKMVCFEYYLLLSWLPLKIKFVWFFFLFKVLIFNIFVCKCLYIYIDRYHDIYDKRDLRRSNHLLKAGSVLGSDEAAWALSNRALKSSKSGACTAPLSSLFHSLAALMKGRNTLPLPAVWPPSVSTHAYFLSSFCHTAQRRPGSIFLHSLALQYKQAKYKFMFHHKHTPLKKKNILSRLNKSQHLSVSSQGIWSDQFGHLSLNLF